MHSTTIVTDRLYVVSCFEPHIWSVQITSCKVLDRFPGYQLVQVLQILHSAETQRQTGSKRNVLQVGREWVGITLWSVTHTACTVTSFEMLGVSKPFGTYCWLSVECAFHSFLMF